jgi:hypothetical protein
VFRAGEHSDETEKDFLQHFNPPKDVMKSIQELDTGAARFYLKPIRLVQRHF